MILPSIYIVIQIYFVYCSPWPVTIWRLQAKGLLWGIGGQKGAGWVSLSMPFNQDSGTISLRSKSYLAVKISSDVVTEHWCHVCVLSMMSLPLLLLAVCWHSPIRKHEYHVVWLHSDRPTWEMIWKMKKFLCIWFPHFTFTEAHQC